MFTATLINNRDIYGFSMFYQFFKPILIIAIFSLFACTSEYSDTLKVGTNIWPGYEPLYLARASGAWKEGSISMIEFNSASEVLRSFRNRSIDVAALTLDEAIALIAVRPDTRIILGTDFSSGADVVIAQPGIEKAEQLKGKKIGVESTALGAYMLARFLKVNHMLASDMQIVYMEVSEHFNAFLRHDIDAVVTFEPVLTELLKQGGNIVFSSQQIPGEILDVLVTRTDVIKNHHDHLELLVNGWFQSLQFIKEQKDIALLKMSPRLGMSLQEMHSAFEGLILLDRDANQYLLSDSNQSIRSAAAKIENVMLSNGLLKEPVFSAQHISNQFVGYK